LCYLHPGSDVVDVLATDVYSGGFAQLDYDTLLALADGKPIGLEFGNGRTGLAAPVAAAKAEALPPVILSEAKDPV
jgi:hypothetical protein